MSKVTRPKGVRACLAQVSNTRFLGDDALARITGCPVETKLPSALHDFLCAYNDELAALGSSLRVAVAVYPWHRGDLLVVNAHGHALGHLPQTVEPIECAAMEALLRTAYYNGRDDGLIDRHQNMIQKPRDQDSVD